MTVSESAQRIPFAATSEAERRLIEAAQLDRARFADVYERYFEFVYGYIARRATSRAEAEDLTSEVFRRALANLAKFKWTGAPFGAWLLRIAANLIADRARRAAKDGLHLDDSSEVGSSSREATSATESQQVQLEHAERRAWVIRMVDELPEDQCRVVRMRFAEEKSISEIAAELGRSEGAVKQLQFRALQNLRAKLEIN